MWFLLVELALLLALAMVLGLLVGWLLWQQSRSSGASGDPTRVDDQHPDPQPLLAASDRRQRELETELAETRLDRDELSGRLAATDEALTRRESELADARERTRLLIGSAAPFADETPEPVNADLGADAIETIEPEIPVVETAEPIAAPNLAVPQTIAPPWSTPVSDEPVAAQVDETDVVEAEPMNAEPTNAEPTNELRMENLSFDPPAVAATTGEPEVWPKEPPLSVPINRGSADQPQPPIAGTPPPAVEPPVFDPPYLAAAPTTPPISSTPATPPAPATPPSPATPPPPVVSPPPTSQPSPMAPPLPTTVDESTEPVEPSTPAPPAAASQPPPPVVSTPDAASTSGPPPPPNRKSVVTAVPFGAGWLLPDDAEPQYDELTAIDGIDDETEAFLHRNGIWTYGQLASLSNRDVELLENQLRETPERVTQERWIDQARALLESVEGA